MSESALAKKMKLKPGTRAALVNAPPGFRAALEPLPDGATLDDTPSGTYDWIQLFTVSQAALAESFPAARAALKPDGMLWISYPKGSSKMQTDLTRDKGWDSLADADLKWITLISVDDTWSAFALRPYRAGEVRQSFR
jgi:hypothetical protein